MTIENKKHNIALELKEAEERLQAAELLHSSGFYKSAAGAAYYVAFHHARALLLMEGLESKTHAGLSHLLNLHFVRSNRLTPEVAKLLTDLQKDREQSEYDAASVFTEAMASASVRQARTFAEAARRLLQEAGLA